MRKIIAILSISVVVLGACEPVEEANFAESLSNVSSQHKGHLVTAEMIIKDDLSAWLSQGRNYTEQRHSPLQQINTDKVSSLGLHWSYGTSRGFEATPFVHHSIMYIKSRWNIVHALDAKNGYKLQRQIVNEMRLFTNLLITSPAQYM